MIPYIILNNKNEVTASGYIQSEDMISVPAGHTYKTGHFVRVSALKKHVFKNNKVVELDEPMYDPGYGYHRATDYPTVGEQLEALWEFIDTNFPDKKTPKVIAMLDQIKAVKQKHKKPTGTKQPRSTK